MEQFCPDTERPLLLCGRSMGIVHLLFLFPTIHSLLSFNPLNGLRLPLLIAPDDPHICAARYDSKNRRALP